MAATSAGALKAYIEGRGLGLAAYRDQAPETAVLPFLTIKDGISVDPELDGARRVQPGGARRSVTEQVQVSLWMRLKPDGDLPGEDHFLPGRLADELDHARLGAAPTAVFGVLVGQTVRLPEPDVNLVQYATTLTIRRERVPR